MTNGKNAWGVPYSQITWFERLLAGHGNVARVERHDDIVFEVDRKAPADHIKMLCCREYTMGVTAVLRGLSEFGAVNIFYIGGGWCGYTREAKEFGLAQKIGIFISDEMTGALWKNDYWAYHKRNKDGHPIYFYRAAGD